MCFPVSLAKFLRTPFCWELLLRNRKLGSTQNTKYFYLYRFQTVKSRKEASKKW